MAKKNIKDNNRELVANCDQFPIEANRANLDTIEVEQLILTIRGQQVILDRDLATLYKVDTKRLNEQVKRNSERFPERFRFQLSNKEKNELVTICDRFNMLKHSSSMPYAFTEQGISMLSTVLHSQTAIEVSIRIMDTFVAMRRFLTINAKVFQQLKNIEYHQIETDKRIDEVFKRLDANMPPQQGIFFDGQVFDAYQFVCDLVRNAKNSIILIDNYVDDTVLTLLDKRKKGVEATIYTSRIGNQFRLDIERHNSQYPHISIELFNKAHDRFLLIDEDVYHIGASIKDLGKKWFGFTLMRDIVALDLLKKIKGEE